LPKEFPGSRLIQVTQPSELEKMMSKSGVFFNKLLQTDEKIIYNKIAQSMVQGVNLHTKESNL